jgi:hypothetical protein
VSAEFAIDRVYTLAEMFNRLETLGDGAPRRKDIVQRLDKIEEVSAELAKLLASADDISLSRLHTGGTGIGMFRRFFESDLMKDADVDGLPAPARCDVKAKPDGWVVRLNALSQYVGTVRTNFLISKGIEDPDRVDRGGNTNLVREEFGSARYQLVQEGWHVFDVFRPDEATGTEGGKFHLFLCAIFELATGLDPEEHSKLMPQIKKACALNRDLKALQLRERSLLRELNKLPPTRKNSRRIREIEEEAGHLASKIFTLLGQIWPSSWSPSGLGNIPADEGVGHSP